MVKDKSNPIEQSINRMKYISKFTVFEGFKDLLHLNYFDGPSSFHSYYHSKKRVLANLAIPKELFYMLGIDVLYVEQLSVLAAMSTARHNRDIIGKARSLVPSSTYCTFHQACLGVIESGYFPLPDVFVAPSFICEETVTLNTYLAKKHNKPIYYIDCPHSTNPDAEAYLAEELHRLAIDLADYFKVKLDEDKIRKTLYYTNEARKWWKKYQDLRQTINNRKFFTANIQTIMYSTLLPSKFGLPQTVDITKKCYEELKMMVDRYGKQGKEDFPRILWLHILPYQSSALVKILENMEINIVSDEMSSVQFDELDAEKPWTSIARRYMQLDLYGSISWRLKQLDRLIDTNRIDAVLELCQPGCKPACGQTNLIKKHLKEKGIPHLSIITDLIESDNASIEQIRTRIEAFVEMLKPKREVQLA